MPENQPDRATGPGAPPIGPRHGVLITRPEAAAARTAARLRALGYQPVIAPLLLLRLTVPTPPARWDAIVLTSGNAVPAVTGLAGPVFAVGDMTAERARSAGLHPVESAGADAATLLLLIRRRLQPGARLLLVTGAGQGGAMAAGLREAGFVVHRRVGYAAAPVAALPDAARAAIGGENLHAALFLSAETARVFVRLLPAALVPSLAGIEALAIAPAVAAVLAPLPWRRVRVSVAPTLDQVLALL